METAHHHSRGDDHARRGEWSAARAYYEEARCLQPANTTIAASLLEIYLIQGDLAAASRLVASRTDDMSNDDSQAAALYQFFKTCTLFLIGSVMEAQRHGDGLMQRATLFNVENWNFEPLNAMLISRLPGSTFQYLMNLEARLQRPLMPEYQHHVRPAYGAPRQAGRMVDPHHVRHENEEEEEDDPVPEETFVISDRLTVRLEDGGQTNIYVDGKRFNQCKYLLLNHEVEDGDDGGTDGNEGTSNAGMTVQPTSTTADEALYNRYGHLEDPGYHDRIIPARAAFWGHCSSLQAWVESGYKASILHANMAFPLLRALSDTGDLKAKRALEREIVARWSSEFEPVQNYLVEMEFLNDLSPRATLKIIDHDKVLDRIEWLLERFDIDNLLLAWPRGGERAQDAIFNILKNDITQLDQHNQAKLLAGCKSQSMAEQLVGMIDVDQMPKELMARVRRNTRINRLLQARPDRFPAGIPQA